MSSSFFKGFFNMRFNDMLYHTFIATIFRSFGAISGFLATLIIAKKLGAVESGYYFLSYSIITILATFCRFGLSNTIIRFVGSKIYNVNDILWKSILFSAVLSISVSIIIFTNHFAIAAFFKKPEFANVLKIMSLALFGLVLGTLIANCLQALKKTKSSIFLLSICVNSLLGFFLLMGWVDNSVNLSGYFSFAIYANAFLAIIIYFYLTPKNSVDNYVKIKSLTSSCIPLWVTSIMTQLLMWSGQLIAGIYEASEVVAQLAVAQRTAALISFVLVAINYVAAPRFSEMYSNSKILELQNLAKWSVKLAALLAFPISIIMIFFPTLIMGLYGNDFESGAAFLVILSIGQLINAVFGPLAFILMMSGFENDMKKISLLTGVIAISCIWLLTHCFGGIGNAIGTSLAVIIQNVLAFYFVSKRLNFNIFLPRKIN